MAIETYSMKDYLNAFRRRSGLFFGILAVVLGIAVALAILPPDTYRASAEMRIDLEGPNIELLEPIVLTTYADQYVKSLQQKVITNTNLRKWLDESDAYWYESDEVTESELIDRLREEIRVLMVFTTVIEEEKGQEVDLITGFTTSFTARDPDAAAKVANSVAAAFLAEDRATRVESAAATSGFLREQIDAKRAQIIEIEAEIATFKEEHAGRLPDLMVLNMTSLERTERELEEVEREIRTQQQDRFFRDAQLQEIRQTAGGSGARLAELETEYLRAVALYGPDHPDVIRTKRQIAALTGSATGESASLEIAQLETELAAAEERYSDVHPDVISMKRRLEALRAQTGSAGNVGLEDPLYLQLRAQINAIDTNLESLRRRAGDLRKSQADLHEKIAGMPQVERQYQILQRELQTATLAFDSLRERLSQAQQIESFESGERGARLQQIRTAEAPQAPTGPPRLAIAILGLFVAGTLAGGAAFVSEITDNTIRGSRDIQSVMRTHAIATVPVVQNSVSRSQRRRHMVTVSLSAMMLAAIIVLVISAITA
ncbi:MAG: GumC family protein [Woeseiaceae bacterium]